MEMSQNNQQLDSWNTLQGKFFHTFDSEGYVRKQGVIIGQVAPETLIVQYFEWVLGGSSTIEVVSLSKIVHDGWVLYSSGESMREAYDEGYVKSRPIENHSKKQLTLSSFSRIFKYLIV